MIREPYTIGMPGLRALSPRGPRQELDDNDCSGYSASDLTLVLLQVGNHFQNVTGAPA